jgi:pyrroline-5-carboxylate reductase
VVNQLYLPQKLGAERNKNVKVGFVGVGNMGRALLKAAVNSDTNASYYATDVSEIGRAAASELGVHVVSDCAQLANAVDFVVLCIKPKDVERALNEMRQELQGKALMSVVAGVKYAQLTELVGEGVRILTALPNLPIAYGSGLVGITSSESSFARAEFELVNQMFSQDAQIVEISEKLLGTFSAVAGSGPAFIAMMAEAMADASVQLGLSRADAYRIAAATLAGTGRMLLETGKPPATVKDEVSSPGGLTIIGVAELESHNFRSAVIKAVQVTANAF